MDRYPYHEYTILLGATRALAHIGVYFTHRVFGLSAGKLSVQELQEMTNKGAASVLELPSEPTVRQLINSEFISEDQVTNGKFNTMESAQATTGFEEIILFYPP